MSSQASVILFTGGESQQALGQTPPTTLADTPLSKITQTPPGRHTPQVETLLADTPLKPDTPPADIPLTATAADGTHPTGMHSCFLIYLKIGQVISELDLKVLYFILSRSIIFESRSFISIH